MKEVSGDFWEKLKELFVQFKSLVGYPLFNLGESEISVKTILFFLLAFVALSFFSNRFRRLFVENLLVRAGVEASARATFGSIARIIILGVGGVIIIQSMGLDLSALGILAGALGVGIGFGLQNITNNFISGIIILFEKPIKVGDRVEVGGVQGNVMSISFRSTQILTNDNISIIVPNSEFISNLVINWSHNDHNIRFKIPVGVSYHEDPDKIKRLLLEVAQANPHVMESPPATVLFDEYGDSSLNFHLAVWTTTHTDKPNVLKSELYFEIFRKFKEHGVEIPFPQRDIHIKSGSIGTSESQQPAN